MFLQRPSNLNHNHVLSTLLQPRVLGPLGPGPNPNVTPWIFLQRPSNPNHNHVLSYNHECWALWAHGPTLMYNHECFYNDPETLITTMRISTTMSAAWVLWAQDPTLMYDHTYFYNDPVILITTMQISTTTSAGPLGPGLTLM